MVWRENGRIVSLTSVSVIGSGGDPVSWFFRYIVRASSPSTSMLPMYICVYSALGATIGPIQRKCIITNSAVMVNKITDMKVM